MELIKERDVLIPEKPGQYRHLGWAALCALGGVSYAWSQHENSPRAAWLLGGILIALSLILVALNRQMFMRFQREGWWAEIEPAKLTEPQTFQGEGWEMDVQEDHIHTINHGRYGPVENVIRYDSITRVDVLNDGTDLILTNEYASPYMAIEWQFLPKPARVALLRWLRERTTNARFSPFAEEVASGWFPRAVR